MRRNIDISIGEFYHLYSRGTDKRVIFMDGSDYRRFIALLYISNSAGSAFCLRDYLRQGRGLEEVFDVDRDETLVDIVAYCLMPNHFHLLVREKIENGAQKFISKLLTAYSMYFNKKYARTGTLFESRFKARHASTDEYLKYLFAYIHLNPIKLIDPEWKENGIQDRVAAKDYLMYFGYSSYMDYQGVTRLATKIINRAAGPEYFTSVEDFDKFVNEWLEFKALQPKVK
ncbi:MAG: transposase [bacterium]|nr:transposase [bacterium]